MKENTASRLRGNLSLVLSCLALVVALSGTAFAAGLARGSVDTKALANGAVTAKKLHAAAVTARKLRRGAVRSKALADRSIRLHDLGGAGADLTNQTTTVLSAISLSAGECRNLSLRTYNPAPNRVLGSMVVGTITTSTDGAVVNNLGAVLPTLATATTQGGVVLHLTVCAGASAQTIPAGSIVTWSLVAP